MQHEQWACTRRSCSSYRSDIRFKPPSRATKLDQMQLIRMQLESRSRRSFSPAIAATKLGGVRLRMPDLSESIFSIYIAKIWDFLNKNVTWYPQSIDWRSSRVSTRGFTMRMQMTRIDATCHQVLKHRQSTKYRVFFSLGLPLKCRSTEKLI